MSKDDDETLDLEGRTGQRVYSYLPYTHWRLKQLLNDYANCHLVPIGGYKCNRVPNYTQHYQIVENSTGKVINPDVTNDTLRCFFAVRGFPLHDEETLLQRQSKRNQGAENFLQAVMNQQHIKK